MPRGALQSVRRGSQILRTSKYFEVLRSKKLRNTVDFVNANSCSCAPFTPQCQARTHATLSFTALRRAPPCRRGLDAVSKGRLRAMAHVVLSSHPRRVPACAFFQRVLGLDIILKQCPNAPSAERHRSATQRRDEGQTYAACRPRRVALACVLWLLASAHTQAQAQNALLVPPMMHTGHQGMPPRHARKRASALWAGGQYMPGKLVPHFTSRTGL